MSPLNKIIYDLSFAFFAVFKALGHFACFISEIAFLAKAKSFLL